jgi:hypothetical protein
MIYRKYVVAESDLETFNAEVDNLDNVLAISLPWAMNTTGEDSEPIFSGNYEIDIIASDEPESLNQWQQWIEPDRANHYFAGCEDTYRNQYNER